MKKILAALALSLVSVQLVLAAPLTDLTPEVREVEKVKRTSENANAADTTASQLPSEPIVPADPAATNDNLYSDKALKNTFFLYQLQEDLKDANDDYRGLNSAISSAQKKLQKTEEQLFTLKEEISFFNRQIQESEKKILNVADQVALKEQEIAKLSEEIDVRKQALDAQKKLLASYIHLQYLQENQFFDSSENGLTMSSAKILLADESVSDTLHEMYSVSLFQETSSQLLSQLDSDMKLLEGMQLNLESKKKRLDELKNRLQEEQNIVEEQKLAKAFLLQETRGDQERYEELIAQSLRQQEETLLEIRSLQDNMRYVQRKLQDFGADVSLGDLKNLVDQRTQEFYEYHSQTDDKSEFQWPVQPTRGISAYFQDAGYRARFGIAHNAIDIPTGQGTPIRAAKDGYVYKVKDNGMGYSYIILSHKDQFTTVYGHVSEILVSENMFVKAGSVIGMSGGTPGTKGAGYLTTGAHLHFEILKEGRYVDPLDYLSLTRLPIEQLPQKYAQKIEERTQSESVLPEGVNEALTREQLPELLEETEKKEHEVLEKEQAGTNN